MIPASDLTAWAQAAEQATTGNWCPGLSVCIEAADGGKIMVEFGFDAAGKLVEVEACPDE